MLAPGFGEVNGPHLNWSLAGGRVPALTSVGGTELRCTGPGGAAVEGSER